MITLGFTVNRKIIRIEISDRVVRWFDDNWPHGLQIYPFPKATVTALLASRNVNMRSMGNLIIDANSGNNLKDYNNCMDDEGIANFIRTELKAKGYIEI